MYILCIFLFWKKCASIFLGYLLFIGITWEYSMNELKHVRLTTGIYAGKRPSSCQNLPCWAQGEPKFVKLTNVWKMWGYKYSVSDSSEMWLVSRASLWGLNQSHSWNRASRLHVASHTFASFHQECLHFHMTPHSSSNTFGTFKWLILEHWFVE